MFNHLCSLTPETLKGFKEPRVMLRAYL